MERYRGKTGDDITLDPDGDIVLYADAQATIAALQARVNGLEKDSELLRQSRDDFRVKYESVKNDAITLQSQLTQRTAELEAAQRERDEAAKDRDDWITSWRALQRHNERIEAELERVRGELVETSLYLQQERANRSSLAACVDRDVKTIKELRTLILTLPKVEGEINERFCTGSYYSSPRDYRTHVTFEAALVALLKHRQGMEG